MTALCPVCVDLDGTLVHADTLRQSFFELAKAKPMRAIAALFSIPRGKARFKQAVARVAPFDAAKLPYREDLLGWLRSERASGRRLILTTGADFKIACAVSAHLGVFEAVIASDGVVNLTGERKAAEIRRYLGNGPFVYAGDSAADMAVWRFAEGAVVVDASPARLLALRRAKIPVLRIFPTAYPSRLEGE